VYALPVRWPLLRVELTSPTVRPRDRSDLRLHRAPLPDHHRALHRGTLPVTSPARTVADCARTQSLRDALVVADAALDRGLTTPEELSSIVAELKGWPAAPSCGRVLALARVAESPGETLLRVDLLDLGFADVVTQARVRGASGRRYRVDLLLPSLGAIGEFDGAVKYGGLDGQPGTDVLAREKQREDDLRLAGWGVFRVTWQELGNLALLRRKLEHAALLSRRAARPA